MAATMPWAMPTLEELEEAERQDVSARDRQLIALKLASPHRAPAGRVILDQADAGHLPLFVAGNEPTLF